MAGAPPRPSTNSLGFGHTQAPCSEPSPVTALGTRARPLSQGACTHLSHLLASGSGSCHGNVPVHIQEGSVLHLWPWRPCEPREGNRAVQRACLWGYSSGAEHLTAEGLPVHPPGLGLRTGTESRWGAGVGTNSAPGGGWQEGLKVGVLERSSGRRPQKEGTGHAAGLHLEEGTGRQPGTFGVG